MAKLGRYIIGAWIGNAVFKNPLLGITLAYLFKKKKREIKTIK